MLHAFLIALNFTLNRICDGERCTSLTVSKNISPVDYRARPSSCPERRAEMFQYQHQVQSSLQHRVWGSQNMLACETHDIIQ